MNKVKVRVLLIAIIVSSLSYLAIMLFSGGPRFSDRAAETKGEGEVARGGPSVHGELSAVTGGESGGKTAREAGGVAGKISPEGAGSERRIGMAIDEGLTGGVLINSLHYSEDGPSGRWVLDAGSATRFEEDGLIFLEDIKTTFTSLEDIDYTLRGDEGKYNESTGIMTIEGNISLVSGDGNSLSGESLNYSTREKVLYTDDTFRFTSFRFDVRGRGLILDIDGGILKVKNDVRTVISNGIL